MAMTKPRMLVTGGSGYLAPAATASVTVSINGNAAGLPPGLYNETVAWPATPKFSTPYGDQGYMLNYTNSVVV